MRWLKARQVITCNFYYDVYVDGVIVKDEKTLDDYEVVDITAPSDVYSHRPVGRVRVDLTKEVL